jgi:pilus assembly protein CpaE
VIVTLGLRGGVGATTLAVNLAGGLTQAGKRVCLVDLSSSGGLAALQLGLRPKTSWADLPAKPDVHNTGAALVRHISGLFVVASPFEPVRYGLARDTFQLMLGVLDAVFADIVIRAAPVLDDATTLALGAAQLVLLVVSPEVGAVQTAIGTLQALPKLSVADHRIRVVLNHNTPDPVLTQSRVEKALGRPVDLIIPYDRAQTAASAQGTPLILSQPNAPLAAAVQSFIAKL